MLVTSFGLFRKQSATREAECRTLCVRRVTSPSDTRIESCLFDLQNLLSSADSRRQLLLSMSHRHRSLSHNQQRDTELRAPSNSVPVEGLLVNRSNFWCERKGIFMDFIFAFSRSRCPGCFLLEVACLSGSTVC